MTTVGITDAMRKAADPIWQAQIEHPFVEGIGTGELETERFENWVRQDYRYLQEFARVFAFGAGKATDLERQQWYATMLDLTLNTEMELHRSYAARFGIDEAELEATEPWPTTRAYTDLLVRTAAQGDVDELVATLLPCAWGYGWIGQQLAERHGEPDDDRYADWIAMYTDEDYQAGVDWLIDEMDRLAEGATKRRREHLVDLFVTSSRYEHRFWEMCYHGEEWSV